MEIHNLESTDFDTIFSGFQRAFSDYDVHFEKEEVRSILKRRGYDPTLSFAAFDNEAIVAFTLNGTGLFNNIPTAYDTGTGTAKEYRGQGLAGKIFNFSLPYLKEAGIRQYLLEVLQNNHKAISVYEKIGFRITRELLCFRQTIADINKHSTTTSPAEIKPLSIESIRRAQTFCDFNPSWQNSMESIERGDSGLRYLGAEIDGALVGFCVFDPATGDLAQIAVNPESRHQGIASRLLNEATYRMKTDFIKVLNVSSDNPTLPAFLEGKNITLASKQFEMLLQF